MITDTKDLDPTGSKIALAIAQALQLPPNLTRLTLTFTATNAPVVECEFDAAQSINAIGPIVPEFARYKLVNDPHSSFHLDIQANLANLAHIDDMLADLDRQQAACEAVTAMVAAPQKGLPALAITQEIRHELTDARTELRAIAESNARIAALLERSVLSQGEPVRFGGS